MSMIGPIRKAERDQIDSDAKTLVSVVAWAATGPWLRVTLKEQQQCATSESPTLGSLWLRANSRTLRDRDTDTVTVSH